MDSPVPQRNLATLPMVLSRRSIAFLCHRAPALAGVAAMCAVLVGLSGSAGAPVSVMRGSSYGSRIFPDNAFTVADKSQLTGGASFTAVFVP